MIFTGMSHSPFITLALLLAYNYNVYVCSGGSIDLLPNLIYSHWRNVRLQLKTFTGCITFFIFPGDGAGGGGQVLLLWLP